MNFLFHGTNSMSSQTAAISQVQPKCMMQVPNPSPCVSNSLRTLEAPTPRAFSAPSGYHWHALPTYLCIAAVSRPGRSRMGRKQAQTKVQVPSQDSAEVYSATSFAVFIQSDFLAWMARLEKECPWHPLCKLKKPLTSLMFAQKGEEVESKLLEWIRTEHSEWTLVDLKGCFFSDINKCTNWREKAAEKTVEALSRADVIYQAPVYDNELKLFGIVDFLLRRRLPTGEEEYVVWDTKLAGHAQGHHLAQLACYAAALQRMGCAVAKVGLVLGNQAPGASVELPAAELLPYFQRGWAAFRAFERDFDAAAAPDPAETPAAQWGSWDQAALDILTKRDDIALVAGLTRLHRRKLRRLGFETLTQLAQLPRPQVPEAAKELKMAPRRLEKLRLQAWLQYKSRKTKRPASRVLAGAAKTLARLPEDDEGDLFLDLEGIFTNEPWGMHDYLIGICMQDGTYHHWWSHDDMSHFEQVLDWISSRRQQFPSLHVYCYGHYEGTAFRRFADSADSRSRKLAEELLSILVDLHPLVKGSLALGLPGYGLKNVEKMFKPPREGAVEDAVQSMVAYMQWQQDGNPELLRQIREYNRDDCISTKKLLSWLRKRCARVPKVAPMPAKEPPRRQATGPEKDPSISKALEEFKRVVDERCSYSAG
ncbi:unnamed protein product [Effrenium voratum]|nr:unnamed protein product [Effrenium voratum]